jgi:homoserine kinase type II
MAAKPEYLGVLAVYPDDCQPISVRSLGSCGGFSGARFWRVEAPCGSLCLRRWPPEHPSAETLEFIQAVLWHVASEGFDLSPLPRETGSRRGYVRHDGYLWELSPWMPGKADFRERPSAKRLQAAMITLAEFHLAAASFPLPDLPESPSPGIGQRLARLKKWLTGELVELSRSVEPGLWAEIDGPVAKILHLVPRLSGRLLMMLSDSVKLGVALQPCIRDVWYDHVLYEGDNVAGLIDFGSMQPDNVACDVARLLGSMAVDDRESWRLGLEAYRSVRPLSDHEIELVGVFDKSTVLMSGLNWIDWIYRQRRVFENRGAIPARLDEIASRLENLAGE